MRHLACRSGSIASMLGTIALGAGAAFPSPAYARETLARAAATSSYDPPAGYLPADAESAREPVRDRPPAGERRRAEALAPWLLALEGYTTAPVDLGARLTFETPFRLRVSAAYGIVPGAYFGIVNDAVESTGAYDSLVADAVEASFEDGQVLRAMIGARPIGGLYLDAGYARVALSGELENAQFGYEIDSTLHMWTAEIGYQAQLMDHLLLAAGAGVMGTFAANSAVSANFDLGRTSRARAITDEAVDEYDGKHERYGILPTLTLRIGWDFF
jgi:hypothetical protein